MTDLLHPALLPGGLHDLLPPDAAHEAMVVEAVMGVFAAHGYDRVKPPLIEFESNLLNGSGAALAGESFRLLDPHSQRMMAVRADMTLQIVRIAKHRLRGSSRPLRLSYAGQVLRVNGAQMRPERQFGQVGVELIGALSPAADAEIILLAVAALRRIGVPNPTIDLCVPTLVPAVCDAMAVPVHDMPVLRAALDRKDAATVSTKGGPAADILNRLMAASGQAASAAIALANIDLPSAADADRRRLIEVLHLVTEAEPNLLITVDPIERRGFEYQTGLSFTLFARSVRGELGRGGRYRTGDPDGEAATGFSLYTDSLLRAVPGQEPARRIFVPSGCPRGVGDDLRSQGWVTVCGLEPVPDAMAEARRLGCGYVLADMRPVPIPAP